MAGFGLDVHLDLQVGALPAETRDLQQVSPSVKLLMLLSNRDKHVYGLKLNGTTTMMKAR